MTDHAINPRINLN